MALARVLGAARLETLRDGAIQQRPERSEQLAGQIPGLLRVARAVDPHRVVERAVRGALQIHVQPLDPAPPAMQQRDGAALHRLDQRDVRDPVVHLSIPVPIVGVVKEGQVAGFRSHHLAPRRPE
jgi:hypothetical protein